MTSVRLLGKHVFDPAYSTSSNELRRVLVSIPKASREICLDMACGNGRNIFLLASYFKHVTGFDSNARYLEEIQSYLPQYQCGNAIATQEIDLTAQIPDTINKADFVCIIHYYDQSLLQNIISLIKPGAFLYIETPGCFGNNYVNLPAKTDVTSLLDTMHIMSYKETACKSSNPAIKRISFKTLIQKSNDGGTNH